VIVDRIKHQIHQSETTTMILSSVASRTRMFLQRSPFLAAFSSSSPWSLSPSCLLGTKLLGSDHPFNVISGGGGADTGRRYKHSERQINRLFRKHPARARVDARLGIERQKPPPDSSEETKPMYEAVHEAKVLPNGWSKPPPDGFQRPQFPFEINRTKNKPNDAIGFLPIYAKFR
jgi:hypothetical protein